MRELIRGELVVSSRVLPKFDDEKDPVTAKNNSDALEYGTGSPLISKQISFKNEQKALIAYTGIDRFWMLKEYYS